jgi:hypothetical protein
MVVNRIHEHGFQQKIKDPILAYNHDSQKKIENIKSPTIKLSVHYHNFFHEKTNGSLMLLK